MLFTTNDLVSIRSYAELCNKAVSDFRIMLMLLFNHILAFINHHAYMPDSIFAIAAAIIV